MIPAIPDMKKKCFQFSLNSFDDVSKGIREMLILSLSVNKFIFMNTNKLQIFIETAIGFKFMIDWIFFMSSKSSFLLQSEIEIF